MNRLSRLAAWAVVGLGALTTIATSRAPTSSLMGSFDRTLTAGETAHVTFHVSEPAMNHVRALGGTLRFRMQTSAAGFTFVADGEDAEVLSIPTGAAAGRPVAEGTCPASGGCDLGVTLEGPADGMAAAMTRIFLDVEVAAQNEFPAGSTITAEED